MNREEFFTELAATAKEAQQAAPHSPTVALVALGGVVQKLAEELAYQERTQQQQQAGYYNAAQYSEFPVGQGG